MHATNFTLGARWVLAPCIHRHGLALLRFRKQAGTVDNTTEPDLAGTEQRLPATFMRITDQVIAEVLQSASSPF